MSECKVKKLNSSKFFLAASITAALSSCGESSVPSKKSMEKCYGIAKTGKNDCASAGNSSCAGSSTIDGDRAAWMVVPKGLCKRIQGGSLISQPGVNKITVQGATEKK